MCHLESIYVCKFKLIIGSKKHFRHTGEKMHPILFNLSSIDTIIIPTPPPDYRPIPNGVQIIHILLIQLITYEPLEIFCEAKYLYYKLKKVGWQLRN